LVEKNPVSLNSSRSGLNGEAPGCRRVPRGESAAIAVEHASRPSAICLAAISQITCKPTSIGAAARGRLVRMVHAGGHCLAAVTIAGPRWTAREESPPRRRAHHSRGDSVRREATKAPGCRRVPLLNPSARRPLRAGVAQKSSAAEKIRTRPLGFRLPANLPYCRLRASGLRMYQSSCVGRVTSRFMDRGPGNAEGTDYAAAGEADQNTWRVDSESPDRPSNPY
jgi:hypothetical protein